ncbi:MAG TPA: protein-L-isoaspartate(D-aspartate) O-methyltransferase [Candidatus Kapabacteria bacterium]|nr:protein-L-isoaspartate(D-aspartate) O-methyltransferase [Candidatus Kapabacteria bacterium]
MALERQHLVDELRGKGIEDERVLDAINHVPRERFLEPVLRHRAYEDNALPIAEGQTISQPYTVAYQSEKLQLGRGEKVLEIGTGCGYQTAVLVEMGCRVYTIERHPKLLEIARKNLDDLGYADRVVSRAGDGTRGWPDFAPFDAIIVTAGAPDVPETLTKQLNSDGGRMVIPVGGLESQTMYLIRKVKGELSGEELKDFAFVPLIGKEGWQV